MREALALLDGARITVQATLLRRSLHGWHQTRTPALLLGQVQSLDGALLTDHLWLRCGRRLAALDLQPGAVVQLTARVAPYYRRHATQPEYGLVYPSACAVVGQVRLPAAKRHRTNASKLLATIATLWREEGKPPSLPKVVEKAPLAPWQVVHALHALADAGRVAFLPGGHVYIIQKEEETHAR